MNPIVLLWALSLPAAPAAEFTEAELKAPFYADLGPAEVDVSSYPAVQRGNYAVFAANCARCHTLARAVNSPTTSRLLWREYMARMRLHSGFDPARPTKAERKAILDFLIFDSRERKILRREEFEALTEKLQLRFAEKNEEVWRRFGERHDKR